MITGFGRTGTLVGRRSLGRRPGHRHDRQGLRRRLPAVGPDHARRRSPTPSPGARRAARRRATAATRSAPPRAPPRSARSRRRRSSRTRATWAPRCSTRSGPSSTTTRSSARCAGRGLFLGIELVRDKKTKEPLSREVTRAHLRRVRSPRAPDDGVRAELPHPAGADDRPRHRAERRRHPARGLRPGEARARWWSGEGAGR